MGSRTRSAAAETPIFPATPLSGDRLVLYGGCRLRNLAVRRVDAAAVRGRAVRHGPAAVPRMGCRALPAGRNGPVCQPRAWLYKRALSPVQPAGGRGDRSAPGQSCNKFVNKS